MEVAFRFSTGDQDLIPSSVTMVGLTIPIRHINEQLIMVDLPEKVTVKKFIAVVEMVHGVDLWESKELPGVFKPQPMEVVNQEVERLLVEQDLELEALLRIPEPQVEINISDPPLDSMVPIGKKIWDSCFVKIPPVANLQQWVLTSEADDCVYLPNDSSRPSDEVEEVVSNAFYTEVLVLAYRLMCKRLGINPSIRLQCGAVLTANAIRPVDGAQHTHPGEMSSRLANSKLIDFDDSAWAKDFIQAICDLEEWQYESENIRRRVLAKVEHILMGRTSHVYNQRLIHALHAKFVTDDPTIPWAEHRLPVANSVMGILKQMVVEGLVLEDSQEIFLDRVSRLGFAAYRDAIGATFEAARSGE